MNENIPVFKMRNGNIVTKYKPRYVNTGKNGNYTSRKAVKMINDELSNMKYEIGASDKSRSTLIFSDRDDVKSRAYDKSTFPDYMRRAGIGSKKDFLQVLEQKKGVRRERLNKIAIGRLNDGYKNDHGFDGPDYGFKKLTGQVHDNKDIIFRRIRGRIIPIRVKKKNRHDLMEESPF